VKAIGSTYEWYVRSRNRSTDQAGTGRQRAGHAILRRVRYREFRPPLALTAIVECFWEVEARDEAHRVVPDGCMDILFHVGDAGAQVIGPMRTAALVEELGDSRTAGVRFRSGAAPALLGLAASDLRDDAAPLGDVWGREGRTVNERLADAAGDLAAVRRVLSDAVAMRVRRASARPLSVTRAVAFLEAHGGIVPVHTVAAEAGVGERQLERLFDQWVGYGPKMLARIVRMRHAARTIERGSIASWASLAADCGYADQAHLIREFRALTGVTPRVYAAGVSEIDNTRAPAVGSVRA
jgi:AraC-like DNA-binding protein